MCRAAEVQGIGLAVTGERFRESVVRCLLLTAKSTISRATSAFNVEKLQL